MKRNVEIDGKDKYENRREKAHSGEMQQQTENTLPI